MKRAFFFIVLSCAAGSSFGQLTAGQVMPSNVPIPSQHYLSEYVFDAPSDSGAWNKEKRGLNAAFASTDERYLRSEVPALRAKSLAWEDTGWRGERLNAQVLVWSPDTLRQVRVTASDLVDGKGQKISRDRVTSYMVRYVLSNYPYGAKNTSCDVSATSTAYLMPDRFEKFDRFELPGMSVRPVWVSIDIPPDAAPGVYTGRLDVDAEKSHETLTIRVTVQNQVLPKPHDWSYRLDLWQNPWVVASYYHVEPWSEEHKALLKKHLKLYADAGGTYITTYAVHSPWSDNSYTIEGAMIDWLKRRDGSWKFDYGIFDQYVQLAMDVGIDEAITIYTPVPWGYRFRYRDEASGNYQYAEWAPGSAGFAEAWKIFLDDLRVHLKEKGWLQKTYLGINENPLDITIAAAKFIKAHSKDWKITYAGDWHPELTELLDDYSPVISSEPSQEEVSERRARGFTTTFYVCCTPPQPNNFVFSPPVEGTYISWYAAAYGYNGFLRWAYDAWPADPLRDARHTFWPAGDCFLVYPGGMSSIRFEKLREGISDFEKIRILREKAAKAGNQKIRGSMAAFEAHLKTFVSDKAYGERDYNVPAMTEAVLKGKKMIDELSSLVGGKM